MVLVGEDKITQFSFLEYQALMLCLAGAICVGLLMIEIAFNRFQVLPLLFPGMFTIRERRFHFYNFDVSDGIHGKIARGEAKMAVRITFFVVLSYLWSTCVLETTQTVGVEFPRLQCQQEADCFVSKFHFLTFFNRTSHTAVDCSPDASREDFDDNVIVSCIRFINPQATNWLLHLAIAHSVTQLNFKCYELLVWIAGNSTRIRTLILAFVFSSFVTILGLWFGGLLTEFASSWLSFVMELSTPLYMYSVWKCSGALDNLWEQDATRALRQNEEQMNSAFESVECVLSREAEDSSAVAGQGGTVVGGASGASLLPAKIDTQARSPKTISWLSSEVRRIASSLGFSRSQRNSKSAAGDSPRSDSHSTGFGDVVSGADQPLSPKGSRARSREKGSPSAFFPAAGAASSSGAGGRAGPSAGGGPRVLGLTESERRLQNLSV